MLLSAVSVLVVAQSSSEIPERLMNNPVYVEVVKGKSIPSQALGGGFQEVMVPILPDNGPGWW